MASPNVDGNSETMLLSLTFNGTYPRWKNECPYFKDSSKAGAVFFEVTDEKDKESLNKLVQQVKVPLPGLFVDEENLKKWGFYEEVYELLSTSGFRTPFTSKILTYQPLVYEFYSTFSEEYVGGDKGWKFQIGGKKFTFDKKQICKWLDFPAASNQNLCYNRKVQADLWQKISGGGQRKQCAADITNPIWKIIHALIAYNFTTTSTMQLEQMPISNKEMVILSAIDQGEVINWYRVLTDLFRLRGDGGKILLGGHFITKIAIRCGFVFNFSTAPKGWLNVLKMEHIDDGEGPS